MKKQHRPLIFLSAIIAILFFSFLIIRPLLFSPAKQASKIVHQFYTYEQQGNFSESWKLFHPYMKSKFPKAAFIQDRAHVFIGHFDTETFNFEISEAEKIEHWIVEKGQPEFKMAYKFIVTQKYSGKYGKFNFQQEVFTVKHKDEWLILWDYKNE